jgi:hypothetical protein
MAGPDTYGGGGGPGPGAWVSFFVGMRRDAHVVRGPGPLATAALRRAGYTVKLDRGKAKYYDPSGKRIGTHAARNVGRIYAGKAPVGSGKSWAKASVAAWRILNPFPTATAAPPPTTWPNRPGTITVSPGASDQVPDTSGRYSPWPPAPTRPAPAPTTKSPDSYPIPVGMPGKFGTLWGMIVSTAIFYGLPYLVKKASESWEAYFKRWTDREAKAEAARHRRTPGGPGQKPPSRTATPRPSADPGRGNPFPSTPAPQIIIVQIPAQPPQVSAPSPAVVPAQTPTATPTTAPAPAPAPKKPLWQQLLEQYGSAPFTQKGKRPIKVVNFMDPLTPSYSTGVDLAPMAFGDYGAWSPDSTGTDACTCPKKKGKKRKKRTVCYRGTYTETASGLTKRKRQKVPCK